jgi:hypothetical protein
VTYRGPGIYAHVRLVAICRYLSHGYLITRVAVWKNLPNGNKVELMAGSLQSIGKEMS